MKKWLYGLLILFFPLLSYTQTLNEEFAGWAKVDAITGTGPTYTVKISTFRGNLRKHDDIWVIDSMKSGDILWSSTGSRFVINSRSGAFLTITDPEPLVSSIPSPGQKIGINRETLINGYLLGSIPQGGDGNGGVDIQGTANTLRAFIVDHYNKNFQKALLKSKDVLTYSGNGAPLFTPGTDEPKIAQGLQAPFPLYKYNGSTWINIGQGTVSDSLLWKKNTWLEEQLFSKKVTLQDSVIAQNGILSNGEIKTQGLSTNGSSTKAASIVNGVQADKDTVVTSNFTLDGRYGTVGFDCSSGSKDCSFPDPSLTENWKFIIRKDENSSNDLILKNSSGVEFYRLKNKMTAVFKNVNGVYKRQQ